MTTDKIVNLDAVCAEYAHTFVNQIVPSNTLPKTDRSKLENTITKSLGVLQEQGVYAFFLFLDAMKEKSEYKIGETKVAKDLHDLMLKLLRNEKIAVLGTGNTYEALQKLCECLDHLLLARELLEQTLIYARYHAKALDPDNTTDPQHTTGAPS